MRIVKDFNENHYKCTLFQHDSKYTLQLEDHNYQIQIKLGDAPKTIIENIEKIVSHPKFKYHIMKSFSAIHDNRIVLDSLINQGGNISSALPEII